MCGQFALLGDQIALELQAVLAQLSAGDAALFSTPAALYIRPTLPAPVCTAQRTQAMRFGLRAAFSKTPIFNARSETAAQKPLFCAALDARRCLVPAAFFYEWQQQGRTKMRHICAPQAPGLFYMAGLYQPGEAGEIPAFALLTLPATGEMAAIHPRMPLILPAALHAPWLHATCSLQAAIAQATHDLRCLAG